MTIERKPRKDAVQSVFTSDRRRAVTYTPSKIGPVYLLQGGSQAIRFRVGRFQGGDGGYC
jgi:hypothetical protein